MRLTNVVHPLAFLINSVKDVYECLVDLENEKCNRGHEEGGVIANDGNIYAAEDEAEEYGDEPEAHIVLGRVIACNVRYLVSPHFVQAN